MELAMVPAGAGRQAVSPATGAKVPGAQVTQEVFEESRYIPAGQRVKLAEFVAGVPDIDGPETVPRGTGEQTEEPLNWA